MATAAGEERRGHTLARGCYTRPLGHVLLSPRCGDGRVLVDHLSTNAQPVGDLSCRSFGGGGGLPVSMRRASMLLRRSLFHRRMTSRCGGQHHEPLGGKQDNRPDELCRGGSRIGSRRRCASRFQQSLCPDGDHPVGSRRFSVIAALALWTRRHHGCFTESSPMIRFRVTCRTKRTGCVSLAAEIRLSIRGRCVM